MSQPDNEDCCMGDGCDLAATRFEEDSAHWHDWIWCDEHAKERGETVPYTPAVDKRQVTR